jgi:hypothetical protein
MNWLMLLNGGTLHTRLNTESNNWTQYLFNYNVYRHWNVSRGYHKRLDSFEIAKLKGSSIEYWLICNRSNTTWKRKRLFCSEMKCSKCSWKLLLPLYHLYLYELRSQFMDLDMIKRLMSYPKCRSAEVINNPARPGSNHSEVNYIKL